MRGGVGGRRSERARAEIGGKLILVVTARARYDLILIPDSPFVIDREGGTKTRHGWHHARYRTRYVSCAL
jgi:hypothetical protein